MSRPALRALAGAVFLAVLPQGGAGQLTCPGGLISELEIRNHSIFAPEDLPETGPLLWAYRLANAVHIRTREDFIMGEILVREGECYDPVLLTESARILREFRFIAQAELAAGTAEDGERRIVVETRDEWTTKATVNLRVEEGLKIEGASIFEENLLGRGITLGVFRVDRGADREWGGTLQVPRLASSPIDFGVAVSQSRGGGAGQLVLIHPFLAERSGTGARFGVQHRRDLFNYVLPEGGEFSNLLLPQLAQGFELSVARRVGTLGDLYLAGGGISYERIRVADPEKAEGVRDSDFSERSLVSPLFSLPLTPHTADRHALRLNALVGVRQLRFAPRRGLDAVDGVQDVPVGREATLLVGRSLGPTGTDRPGDLFGKAGFLAGWAQPRWVGQVKLSTEGRREDSAPGEPGRWRDVLTEGHAIVYFLTREGLLQSVVLRGSLHAGWRTTAPFQLTLGGAEGVRGYSETAFPGGRRAVGTVEARFRSPGPFPGLADLGFTLFGDVGGIWAGDAPFGADSGILGAVGGGIRVGFPAGSSSVIRFDLAFPVGPGAGDRGPILRIAARDWIGVSGASRSPQLHRSRRSGIRGEFVGIGREGGAP